MDNEKIGRNAGAIAPADGNFVGNGVRGGRVLNDGRFGVEPGAAHGGTYKDGGRQDAGATNGAGNSAASGGRGQDEVRGSGRGDDMGATESVDLGPNFELLEELRPELVNALRELVRQYRTEGVVARRHEIRRIRQARLFWQGLQYGWWNPNDMNWHLPYEQKSTDDSSLEEMPRYQFVTNFYQGFGLSFVAVLSQDVPSVRFYPQSAQSLVDIAAARASSDVAELVERNNHVEHLLTSIGYFLWTDGKLGAYVRYVADGQRFGFREEEILEAVEIPLGEDVWVCGECGREERYQISDIGEQEDGNGRQDAGVQPRSLHYGPQKARTFGRDDSNGGRSQDAASRGAGRKDYRRGRGGRSTEVAERCQCA